jgi:hypothetical protein
MFARPAHVAIADVTEQNAERDAQVDRVISRAQRLRGRCDLRPHLANVGTAALSTKTSPRL